MPLTDFQREVLAVIVANRSEESHFAGGLVLNSTPESPRFSKDFVFFHDPIEMKMEWIGMCDQAEEEIVKLANTQPDMPIGVAFVDTKGEPGWIGRDPTLRIHRLSLHGSWPETMEGGGN